SAFFLMATAEQPPILKITWLTNNPVWVKQWPMTETRLKIAKQLIQEQQLDAGHIRPSVSLWNTPIFVIPKKSGWLITDAQIRPQKVTLHDHITTLHDAQKLFGDLQWVRTTVDITNDDLLPFLPWLRGSDANSSQVCTPEQQRALIQTLVLSGCQVNLPMRVLRQEYHRTLNTIRTTTTYLEYFLTILNLIKINFKRVK
ncbi:hypothetical protein HGM15179_020318, partial [Zosterops borbonicus]